MVPAFVEQLDGDDVGGEAWQEVDVRECPMLAVLAGENHGAEAFDPCDESIPESHGSVDIGVEVGERRTRLGHMVGRPGVEDPLLQISITRDVECNKDLLLSEVELVGEVRQ